MQLLHRFVFKLVTSISNTFHRNKIHYFLATTFHTIPHSIKSLCLCTRICTRLYQSIKQIRLYQNSYGLQHNILTLFAYSYNYSRFYTVKLCTHKRKVCILSTCQCLKYILLFFAYLPHFSTSCFPPSINTKALHPLASYSRFNCRPSSKLSTGSP